MDVVDHRLWHVVEAVVELGALQAVQLVVIEPCRAGGISGQHLLSQLEKLLLGSNCLVGKLDFVGEKVFVREEHELISFLLPLLHINFYRKIKVVNNPKIRIII